MKRSQRQCQSHIFLYCLLSLPSQSLLSARLCLRSSLPKILEVFIFLSEPSLLLSSFYLFILEKAGGLLVMFDHAPQTPDHFTSLQPSQQTHCLHPPRDLLSDLSLFFSSSLGGLSLLPFRKLLAFIHILSSPQFPHLMCLIY